MYNDPYKNEEELKAIREELAAIEERNKRIFKQILILGVVLLIIAGIAIFASKE